MDAKISITGRLTANPELRFTPNGSAVVKFDVAINERKLNKATNQWEDGEAMFLRVEAWKQLAESAADRLEKGDLVTVVGDLKPDNWEKDGQKRIGFKVAAKEIAASVRGRKNGSHVGVAPVQEPAW